MLPLGEWIDILKAVGTPLAIVAVAFLLRPILRRVFDAMTQVSFTPFELSTSEEVGSATAVSAHAIAATGAKKRVKDLAEESKEKLEKL